MRNFDFEEAWATGLLILIAMGGYVPVLMAGLSESDSRFHLDSAAPNPVSRIVILCLLFGTLVAVVRSFSAVRRSFFSILPLLPYITVAVASVLWTQQVGLSVRRMTGFLITCLFGLYFAARFPIKTQIRIVLTATSLLAVGSVLLVWISPTNALDNTMHVGAWQGVFAGKNACAMSMVVGLAAAQVYKANSITTQLMKLCCIALFLVVIFMAQSSGAVVMSVVLAGLVPLLHLLSRFQRQSRAMICALLAIGFVLTAAFVIPFLPEILKALNRNPTLTGRTLIWADVLRAIAKRPLLGYGYGAFWTGVTGTSANVVLELKWNAPNAHDGYLDIWLSLGLLGLVMFFLAMAQTLRRVWQVVMSQQLLSNIWLPVSILLVLLYNIDESVLISGPNLMWTLLVVGVCSLELNARSLSLSAQFRRSLVAIDRRRSFAGHSEPSVA
jgi:O-antigen ligase